MGSALALLRDVVAHAPDLAGLALPLEEVADTILQVARSHPEPALAEPLSDATEVLRGVWSRLRALAALLSAQRLAAVADQEKQLNQAAGRLDGTVTALMDTETRALSAMERELSALEGLPDAGAAGSTTDHLRTIAGSVRETASAMGADLACSSEELRGSRRIIQDAGRRVRDARRCAIREALPGVVEPAVLDQLLDKALSGLDRTRSSCCLAVLDIDQLGEIDRRFGPAGADALFVSVVELVLGLSGRYPECGIGHYADRQIGIVSNPCSFGRGRQMAEVLRSAVASSRWQCRTGEGSMLISITISIALTQPRVGERIEGIRARADAKLEQAKRQGGNCVAARR